MIDLPRPNYDNVKNAYITAMGTHQVAIMHLHQQRAVLMMLIIQKCPRRHHNENWKLVRRLVHRYLRILDPK